jgi:hypothetical protein
MKEHASVVAEVQGLYGPFSFGEKLLQRIWMRGDFAHCGVRLLDGRSLRVIYAGKWNLLGGPDFKSARVSFDGEREITIDVELHLHASDWVAHRHAQDPAYDNVGLHVVLFPPEPAHITYGVNRREIPVLVLLPLLQHDLEEFAADEAIEVLSGQSAFTAPEELASLDPERLFAVLRERANARWQRKVHFAQLRLHRLGWQSACHHAALEVLGYRFNRAPMLRIAGRWSLEDWSSPSFDPEEIFASEYGRWSLQGVRPANSPRTRLQQYAAWTRAVPDWPSSVLAFADNLPQIPSAETRDVRRIHCFAKIRESIAGSICGNALGGTRLDNFFCDALLPLHTARARDSVNGRNVSFNFEVWFHWFPGDQSPPLLRILRQLGVTDGRAQPSCHGFAQGLFDWFIERDARR